jgi:hypothetical protein
MATTSISYDGTLYCDRKPSTDNTLTPQKIQTPTNQENTLQTYVSVEHTYSKITLKYAIFIKQFISQLAYAKYNMEICRKTTDVLNYMRLDSSAEAATTHAPEKHREQIYSKIMMEYISENSCEIWDVVFTEHNVAIVLQYYIDIINHLLEYPNATECPDPVYTYSPETVVRNLFMNRSEVYSPDVRGSSLQLKTYREYQQAELRKQIQNSIVYDVYQYIAQTNGWRHLLQYMVPVSGFNPRSYYVYLEHFKQKCKQLNICIVDNRGNLEITDSVLETYANQPRFIRELYSVGLLHIWLTDAK